MGSPTSYFSGGNTALGNWGDALYGQSKAYLGALNYNNSVSQSFSSGIGNLMGGAIGLGMKFL